MNNDIPDKLSTLIDPIVKKAVKDAIASHAERGELISISRDGKVVTLPAAEVIKERSSSTVKK